jgi:hypothetical protein
MQAQDWPGNYDELTRTVLNAARFASSDELTLAAISAGWAAGEPVEALAAIPHSVGLNEMSAPSSGKTRPPFPIKSAIASDAVVALPTAAVVSPVSPVLQPVSSVAQAPASQLFARSSRPTTTATPQSMFRPASSSYNFTEQLVASLTIAGVCSSH